MSLNKLTDVANKKDWMNINCKSIKCEDITVTGGAGGDGDTVVNLAGGVEVGLEMFSSTETIRLDVASDSTINSMSGTPTDGQVVTVYCNFQNSTITIKDGISDGNVTIDTAGSEDIVLSGGDCAFMCFSLALAKWTCSYGLSPVNSVYGSTLSDTTFYSLAQNVETPVLSNAVSNVIGTLEPSVLEVGKSYKLEVKYLYITPNAGTAQFNVYWGGESLMAITGVVMDTVNNIQTMTLDYTFTIVSVSPLILTSQFDIQFANDTNVWSRKSELTKATYNSFVPDTLGLSYTAELNTTGLDMTLMSAVLKSEYQ